MAVEIAWVFNQLYSWKFQNLFIVVLFNSPTQELLEAFADAADFPSFSKKLSKFHPLITITMPILISLHWLPVRYRINFKVLLLTFKAICGMAPSYIVDLIHTKTYTCYLLRSNEGVLLKLLSGKMEKSLGDRSFSVAAPTLWNALPVSLCSIKCISTFKANLKTYLFKLAFNIS